MPKSPYNFFSQYVLRTPLLSLNFFENLTSGETISGSTLKKICTRRSIQEALFLASPDLYMQMNKWLEDDLSSDKIKRLRISILKYLSRMSSRCTPFGLFAGTAVGSFSKKTNLELDENFNNGRHTRLDMNYLVALTKDIEQDKSIRDQLKFYPNSSLYSIGGQNRYVEYEYVKTKRIHHIVGTDETWYLNKILESAEEGATLLDLVKTIVNEEISFQEAFVYVVQLIDNQILISELEPSVSGPDFLEQILEVLRRLKNTDFILRILEEVNNKLFEIDNSLENEVIKYQEIASLLEKLETPFELKYLFQTNMIISTKANNLSYNYGRKIKNALVLLNKLSNIKSETPLSKFSAAFYERYETKPVSLSKALDKDLGLGFSQDSGHGDISLMVDDLFLPSNTDAAKSYKITVTQIQEILHKKLINCLSLNQDTILLHDQDFEDFDCDWSDLPDTMSCMTEIYNIGGKEKIGLSYVGGSSAANLLGRFCHGDPEIRSYCEKIVNTEEILNKDKILAEIVHLPESRIGNILFRPHLRNYEIPYLASSILPREHQIDINDLEIYAKGSNKVFLRSKRHGKEVLPRLTNAHNFSSGALPVYQFLASQQFSSSRSGIGFSWGPFSDDYEYLPRVEYMDIILSPKQWNLNKLDIESLLKISNDNNLLKENVKKFINLKGIPEYCLLKDGDNELLINFNNLSSVRMFLHSVRKRNRFKIIEFLHKDNSTIKSKQGSYTNQIIVSFYHEERLNKVS